MDHKEAIKNTLSMSMSITSLETGRRVFGNPPYQTGRDHTELVVPGVHAAFSPDGDKKDPLHVEQTKRYLDAVYHLGDVLEGTVRVGQVIPDTLAMLQEEGLVAEQVKFDGDDPLLALVDSIRDREDECYLIGLSLDEQLQMVMMKDIRFSQPNNNDTPRDVEKLEIYNIHTGQFLWFSRESFIEAWGQLTDEHRFICFRISYPHKQTQ